MTLRIVVVTPLCNGARDLEASLAFVADDATTSTASGPLSRAPLHWARVPGIHRLASSATVVSRLAIAGRRFPDSDREAMALPAADSHRRDSP